MMAGQVKAGIATKHSKTSCHCTALVNGEMPMAMAHMPVSAGNQNTDLTHISPRSTGAEPGGEVKAPAFRGGQLSTL